MQRQGIFSSIPVAASGKVCADWFASSAEVEILLGSGKTEVNLGWIYVVRFLSYAPAMAGQADSATARLMRTQSPFQSPFLKRLDAGPAVTLTLPDGSTRTLVKQQTSNFSFSATDASAGAPLFIPAAGGTFRFEGTGGPDAGPFEASIRAEDPLVGNEQTTLTAASRSQPLTVTWRGARGIRGDPRRFLDRDQCGDLHLVWLHGTGEAGQYTVPRDVLASMVPSMVIAPLNIPTGSFLVQYFTRPARFTATGLNHGSIVWESYSATVLHFQ